MPITFSTARKASGTPAPVAADSTSGVFLDARLSRAICCLSCSGVSASALLSATISGLSVEPFAVGVELGAHGLVGLARVLAGAVDEMQQHAAALDVAEEAVAEAGAFMRAFDQARDVGQHEFDWSPTSTTPSCGCSVVKG